MQLPSVAPGNAGNLLGYAQEDWLQSMVHLETHSTCLEVFQLTLDLTIENYIFCGDVAGAVGNDTYYSL